MRKVKVVLICDEGFVADSLREFATAYEDNFGDWHEVEHGSGFLEFVEVPDPEPSLAEVFDKKRESVMDERERRRRELERMDEEEREWVMKTAEKLAFLRERGFQVKPYFGGIVDGWPYNYVHIGRGRWVDIEGSSVRREDGRLNQSSPYIANYLNPTMEALLEEIATW